MASVNARAVALDVVKMVEKGQKVNHRSLLKKHGYSDSVSLRPTKVTNTKTYQSIVNPALKKMESVRHKALVALEKKDYHQEKTPVLIQVVDVMTKNSQLLGGKATENVGVVVDVSEVIHNKYGKLSKSDESQKDVSNGG